MQTKQALQEEIAMTLAVAPPRSCRLQRITTGAANDIEKITATAKQIGDALRDERESSVRACSVTTAACHSSAAKWQ